MSCQITVPACILFVFVARSFFLWLLQDPGKVPNSSLRDEKDLNCRRELLHTKLFTAR